MPLLEIFLLIQVGKAIGGLVTIAIVIATAVLGVALLRKQGYATLLKARVKLSQNTVPAQEIVEGLFLAVGGVLLLTPGFITDILGLCCLIPGVRQGLIVWGMRHLTAGATVRYSAFQETRKERDDGRTIEGEYRRDDE